MTVGELRERLEPFGDTIEITAVSTTYAPHSILGVQMQGRGAWVSAEILIDPLPLAKCPDREGAKESQPLKLTFLPIGADTRQILAQFARYRLSTTPELAPYKELLMEQELDEENVAWFACAELAELVSWCKDRRSELQAEAAAAADSAALSSPLGGWVVQNGNGFFVRTLDGNAGWTPDPHCAAVYASYDEAQRVADRTGSEPHDAASAREGFLSV